MRTGCLTVALVGLTCVIASSARAGQHGKPAPVTHAATTGHGKPTTPTHGKPTTTKKTTTTTAGKSTTPSSTSTSTTPISPIAQKIASHPQLASRLESMLPQHTTLNEAATGFKNQGQFIAALHVSQNLGIPFPSLKTQMVDKHLSLGQSIQALRPTADAASATHEAETETTTDLKAAGISTTTTTTRTKKKPSSGDSH